MPFPSAIADYTPLRGNLTTPPRWSGAQYLLLASNTVVLAARVNGTPTGKSFAQINYHNVTVGSYTNVEIGMTVLISKTSDQRQAFFVGRVRAAPTASILYINETSAGIASGDYVWVIRDWRVHERLARVSGGTYYKDWNLSFSQPAPVIYGLQSAYAGIVSGSPAGYTVAFAAQAFAVASGATIASYAWTIPAGGTVVAGSASSANVTVRFDASTTEYWVRLVVTDSGGRTATRWIPVWALAPDLAGAPLAFSGATITADIESGWEATIDAFDLAPNVLDETLCVLFTVERYNHTAQSLVTNINFVGRLRTDVTRNAADDRAGRITETTFTIEGVDKTLARIAAPLIKIRHAASPTVWDEIANLTVWRAVCHLLQTHTTYLTTHSLEFDSLSNTFLYDTFTINGQSVLDAIRDLLGSINAEIEWAASGEARVGRDARYLTTAERSALPTIGAWDNRDVIDLRLNAEHRDRVGQIRAFGGSYNSAADRVTAVASFWPGQAQGEAEGRLLVNGQVLAANQTKAAAQAELNRRAGYRAAVENARLQLEVDHPDGYHFLTPSVRCWYTWALDAAEARRELTASTRWLLTSISTRHDNVSGTRQVTARYVAEAEATEGRTYEPPPVSAPSLPIFPPLNVYPAFPDLPVLLPPSTPPAYVPPVLPQPPSQTPDTLPADGNTVLIWTQGAVFWTQSFLTTPNWVEVTPPGLHGTIRSAALGLGRDAYVLSSDGTQSQVYYTANVFAPQPAWTSSPLLSGEYTVIRQTPTAGSVLIYGRTGTGSWSHTFDFTASNGGFSAYTDAYGSYATHVAGSGWRGNYFGPPTFTDQCQLLIERTIAATTFTRLKARFEGSATGSMYGDYGFLYDSPSQVLYSVGPQYNIRGGQPYDVEWVGSQAITTLMPFGNETGTTSTDLYLTRLECEGLGVNPFATSGIDVEVRYSSSYGAAFTAPIVVGDVAAGATGFDVIRIGGQSLAGRDGQVELATALGGAYTNYGSAVPAGAQPTCIHIPRFQFASTTAGNTTTSTPQYLLGSSALTAGNQALWRVTSSGTTFTDITPTIGGNYGLAVSPDCLTMPWRRGDYILAILQFGSTPRLVVSTNSGASWNDLGVLSASARAVRTRKGDAAHRQAFLTNNGPAYIPNYRAASPVIYTRAYPATDPVLGIEVYG